MTVLEVPPSTSKPSPLPENWYREDEIDQKVEEVAQIIEELHQQENEGVCDVDWERIRGYPGTYICFYWPDHHPPHASPSLSTPSLCHIHAGVMMEPMAWEEASTLIRDGSLRALSILGRSPQGIKKYHHVRDSHILATYATVTDYLYATVFNIPCVTRGHEPSNIDDGDAVNSTTRLVAVVPADFGTTSATTTTTVWKENDFPYNFEPGIEHHVLWSSASLTTAQLVQEIEKYRDSNVYEWVSFVNPNALKSIPTIWHAHIVSRRKTTE